MNVLSVFDGMSCGQIALNRANIKYNKYYASEIKPHAIKITQHNYPNTIQLGDVRQIKANELPIIDLFIGGSPCQDLSSANKVKLGLQGLKSRLFYEYVRILKELKEKNKDVKFLLENVASMDNEDVRIISEILGIWPVRINSYLVSAQLRDRYYWTNIRIRKEGLFEEIHSDIPQPKDKGIKLSDIIENGFVDREKSLCILARYKSSSPAPEKYLKRYEMGMLQIVFDNMGGQRLLTQTEIERLQTVPEGYTSILPYNQAVNLLGDGWTVDVVAHILSFLETN